MWGRRSAVDEEEEEEEDEDDDEVEVGVGSDIVLTGVDAGGRVCARMNEGRESRRKRGGRSVASLSALRRGSNRWITISNSDDNNTTSCQRSFAEATGGVRKYPLGAFESMDATDADGCTMTPCANIASACVMMYTSHSSTRDSITC